MDQEVRSEVRTRAKETCEYCRLKQKDQPAFRFHIEHIRPRKHGGGDALDNLALACQQCNLHKGPNLSGVDPETGRVVRLFHPRDDIWSDHFLRDGAFICGQTPIGRATAHVLQFNKPDRVRLRLSIA